MQVVAGQGLGVRSCPVSLPCSVSSACRSGHWRRPRQGFSIATRCPRTSDEASREAASAFAHLYPLGWCLTPGPTQNEVLMTGRRGFVGELGGNRHLSLIETGRARPRLHRFSAPKMSWYSEGRSLSRPKGVSARVDFRANAALWLALFGHDRLRERPACVRDRLLATDH